MSGQQVIILLMLLFSFILFLCIGVIIAVLIIYAHGYMGVYYVAGSIVFAAFLDWVFFR